MLPALCRADAHKPMNTSRLDQLAERMGEIPEKVLAGFSGGCDSTALVLLLLKRKVSVTCVHVHHGLRGEEADADEAFVRAFCEQHAIPLLVYHAKPPVNPGEGWAREARYAFFRMAMQQTGAQALVLAHHSDDQAETFLLHLLRGSGLEGLCAMKRISWMKDMRILRPLLGISHHQLQEALTEAGQEWREDSTNAEDDFLRNRVRHQLLPTMERISPGAAERIAVTSQILQEDAELLEHLVHQTDDWMGRSEIPLDVLQCPGAQQSRILRAWWASLAGARKEMGLSHEKTMELQSIVQKDVGAVCNLPGSMRAVRGYQYLHMLSSGMQKETAEWRLAHGLEALSLRFMLLAGSADTGNGKTSQAIPEEWVRDLTVRTRRSGDWIIPFGQSGRQPLKEYFIDRKVDQPFRDRIPLICRGQEVLVVCGIGAGGVPKRPEQTDRPYVLISWHGDMPWLTKEKEK